MPTALAAKTQILYFSKFTQISADGTYDKKSNNKQRLWGTFYFKHSLNNRVKQK